MMHDIYEDLDNFDMGDTINELKEKNAELTQKVDKLVKQLEETVKNLEEVKKENVVLTQNISKLYNTAKADYDRRTRIIADLRKQVDDLLFKRNQGQNFKIPKRKAEIVEKNDAEPQAKKCKIDNQALNNKKKSMQEDKFIQKNKDTFVNKGRDRNQTDRRSQDKTDRKFRRSRTRSRSRERKSDVRRRPERDNNRNRPSNSRHSPDRKPKNDNLEDSFQEEQRRVLEMIKKRQSRQNDVECISLDSRSSNDSSKPKKDLGKLESNKKEDGKKDSKNKDCVIESKRPKEKEERNLEHERVFKRIEISNKKEIVKESIPTNNLSEITDNHYISLKKTESVSATSKLSVGAISSNKADSLESTSKISNNIKTSLNTYKIESSSKKSDYNIVPITEEEDLEEGEISDNDSDLSPAKNIKVSKDSSPHSKKRETNSKSSRSDSKRLPDENRSHRSREVSERSNESSRSSKDKSEGSQSLSEKEKFDKIGRTSETRSSKEHSSDKNEKQYQDDKLSTSKEKSEKMINSQNYKINVSNRNDKEILPNEQKCKKESKSSMIDRKREKLDKLFNTTVEMSETCTRNKTDFCNDEHKSVKDSMDSCGLDTKQEKLDRVSISRVETIVSSKSEGEHRFNKPKSTREIDEEVVVYKKPVVPKKKELSETNVNKINNRLQSNCSEIVNNNQEIPSCSQSIVKTEASVAENISRIETTQLTSSLLSSYSDNAIITSEESSIKRDIKSEINEKENIGNQNITQMVTPMVKPKPKRPRCRLLP